MFRHSRKFQHVGPLWSLISLKRVSFVLWTDISEFRVQSLDPGTNLEAYEFIVRPLELPASSPEDQYLINDFKVRKVLQRAKETRKSRPCLNSTNIKELRNHKNSTVSWHKIWGMSWKHGGGSFPRRCNSNGISRSKTGRMVQPHQRWRTAFQCFAPIISDINWLLTILWLTLSEPTCRDTMSDQSMKKESEGLYTTMFDSLRFSRLWSAIIIQIYGWWQTRTSCFHCV